MELGHDPDDFCVSGIQEDAADPAPRSAALWCCSNNFPEGLTPALENDRTHPQNSFQHPFFSEASWGPPSSSPPLQVVCSP